MHRLREVRLRGVLFAIGIALLAFPLLAILQGGPPSVGPPPPADVATVARTRATLPTVWLDGVPGAAGRFCWDGVCSSDEGLGAAPLVTSAVKATFPTPPTRVLAGMVFEPGNRWRTLAILGGQLGSSAGATYVEVNVRFQENRSVVYAWRLK